MSVVTRVRGTPPRSVLCVTLSYAPTGAGGTGRVTRPDRGATQSWSAAGSRALSMVMHIILGPMFGRHPVRGVHFQRLPGLSSGIEMLP